ncbi:MAG TPA: UDP-N-acetylmuramate dehydrogenase [Bdellovibrionota bacterium]|nr:UDP-N-acetylmuramate dehydrogenase [Bdellovibrionota bacterium]
MPFKTELKFHTTLRLGGKPQVLFIPKTLDELIGFVKEYSSYAVLGGGSNILAPDEGVPYPVIKLSQLPREIKKIEDDEDFVLLRVSSNTPKSQLLSYCLEHGLEGAEFLAGIPGNIGGGIAMNAGTSEGEFSDIVDEVSILKPNEEIISLSNDEVGFSYRRALLPQGAIVLSVILKLKVGDGHEIKRKVKETLEKRNKTQPVREANCGCIFKNPMMNGTRVSAGKLIDEAGLKEKQIGGALISAVHGNFFVNVGNAKASDMIELIRLAEKKVYEKYRVTLEEEVCIWK